HCMDILHSLEAAETAINPDHDRNTVLRIDTMPSFATHPIAPLMPEFHALHPRIRVEFILSAAPANTVGERIDVAIYSGHQPDSSLVARRLTNISWKLLASPDYLATHGTPQEPSDLINHRCLNF